MPRQLLLSGLIAVATISKIGAQANQEPTYILSGMVVTDEGTPFPEPVEMSLICSGDVLQKAFSNGGQFSFQLSETSARITGNADEGGAAGGGGFRTFNRVGRESAFGGRINLTDCEIMGALPGFSSSVIGLGVRDLMASPTVGEIVMHRLDGRQAATVSFTSATAPPNAVKEFDRARKELGKPKANHSKAIRQLEKAVKIYPEYASAWYTLGKTRRTTGALEAAQEAFRQASVADPDYLAPLVELSEMALQGGRLEEASQLSAQVIERNPDVIQAHYIRAYAEHGLGNVQRAEESLRKVQESPAAEGYPGTYYLLGAILANRGELQPAADALKKFLELQPDFGGAAQLREQLSSWEKQGLISPG